MHEDEVLAKGLKKEKSGFSLVWIAPIIAILITTGMIYKTYVNAGTRITIIVNNGDGIKDGKTPIMYKGIKVGVVEDIHIKEDDVSKLELIALIDKAAAEGITREGNMFWMVKPKVSITEVSGLDTIVSGIYIAVMPVKNTKEELFDLPYQDEFVALDSPPVDIFDPGLAITVNTLNKGDIAIGAPVLYNKQAIGKVEDKKLSTDRLSIDLFLRIESKYADLVHEESIFYKADAVEVKASLSEIKVHMGSFASFIAGGISMHNTTEAFSSALARDNTRFTLYDNRDEIMLSDDVVTLLMQDHHSLSPDISKIFYKGVEVGVVKTIDYEPKKDQTRIRVKLHKKFRGFANEKAYFWIVKPQLEFNKISGLDTIVKGNYIQFVSSDIKAKKADTFILHEDPPQPEGKHIRLIANNIQGIKAGAALYYHDVKIGSVNGYTINKDKKSFNIDLIVLDEYKNLINASSMFYHYSGLSLNAGLHKVSIETGSLETMMRGGIAVDTFSFNKKSNIKKVYRLFDDKSSMLHAHYLSTDGLTLTLNAHKAYGLKPGAPVLYKQMKAGEVIGNTWDAQSNTFRLKAFIEDKFVSQVHPSTLFYNVSGVEAKVDLEGLKVQTTSLSAIIKGGVSFFNPSKTDTQKLKAENEFFLYADKNEANSSFFTVKLTTDNPSGLKEGSLLKYKDIVIGKVENLKLLDSDVEIEVHIQSDYAYLVSSDTHFWIETFRVGLDGLKNPSSALFGPYISLLPGTLTAKKYTFDLHSQAPVPHFREMGLRITLLADRLSGLKQGSAVYYRQVNIGTLVQYHLSKDARHVELELFIQPCYAHLIRKNSYFFNTSGIGVNLNLFGAKMQTESLESILSGGIGVLTPDEYEEKAEEMDQFRLHNNLDEDALEWSPELYGEDELCQQ